MTRTTIKSMLRAAVFTGTIAALPVAALGNPGGAPGGDEATARVPDHAAAEAGSVGEAIGKGGGTSDHATAEARNAGGKVGASGTETSAGAPDHAAAEARGATDQTRE